MGEARGNCRLPISDCRLESGGIARFSRSAVLSDPSVVWRGSRILRLHFRHARTLAQDSTLSVVLSLSKDEAEGSKDLAGSIHDFAFSAPRCCLAGSIEEW